MSERNLMSTNSSYAGCRVANVLRLTMVSHVLENSKACAFISRASYKIASFLPDSSYSLGVLPFFTRYVLFHPKVQKKVHFKMLHCYLARSGGEGRKIAFKIYCHLFPSPPLGIYIYMKNVNSLNFPSVKNHI